MVTSQPPDAELVVRAQHGELAAYEELVRRYQQLVIRVAHVITGNSAEAEDAAQEVFIKVYSSLSRVRPDSFRPWLLRVTVNEARNLRKAARRRAVVVGRGVDDLPVISPAPTPEMAVLADEQRSVLFQALDGLRDDDRLAIGYRYFFDLSESEMVEALGWPRGTVKSRLSRALGRFRLQLGHLAILPAGAFGLPHVARQLAGWDQTQLEHGLTSLGAHLSQLPVNDLSASLVQQLHAANVGSGGPGWARHTALQALGVGVGLIAIVAVGAVMLRPTAAPVAQPTVVNPVSASASAPVAQAPVAPTPSSNAIVVYGADLTEQDRAEVRSLLDADLGVSVETISRDEVLSTLAAAGLPVAPTDETVSSVRLSCPSPAGGLTVRTEHITALSPLTYATALLAGGSTDALVVVAAPAARPVTGETAMVGMLRAAGRCTGREAQTSARVSQAYLVIQLTSRVASASGNWPAASAIVARTVQAVVTGQAQAEPAIASALAAAAADAGLAVDANLRAQVASALAPLVGRDYGPFARGYRIDQLSPSEAHFVP